MKNYYMYTAAAAIGLAGGISSQAYYAKQENYTSILETDAVDAADGTNEKRAQQGLDSDHYQQCLALLPNGISDLNLRATLAKWVEHDPGAALAFIDANVEDESDRHGLLGCMYSAWALVDEDAAISHASELESDSDYAMECIARALRKTNPIKAAAIDLRHVLTEEEVNEFWRLTSQNVMEVESIVGDKKFDRMSLSIRTALLTSIAEAKYNEDPRMALEWLSKLSLPKARLVGISSIVGKMAKLDPQLAVSSLQSIPNWADQEKAVEAVARGWHESDAGAALQWLGQSLQGESRALALQELLNDTLASDPSVAARYAVELTLQGETNFANFTRIAGRYAEEAPSEALQWLGEIPDNVKVNKASAAAEVAASWSLADPSTARAAWAEIKDPILASGFARGLGEAMGETDAVGALKWLDSMSKDDYESNAPYVLSGYAKSSPADASERVAAIEDTMEQTKAAGFVATQWANSDPMEAGNWATSIEDPIVQSAAIGSVVRSWSRADPNAAAEWVSTFPSGVAKDAASAEVAQAVVIADPEAAFQWAVAIEDASTQWKTLPSIVASWAVRDASAALKAIETADLPPSRVDGLNQLVKNVAP